MSLPGDQLARTEDGRIELRPTPLRVRWELSDLLCSDGHRLRAVFSCSIEALDDPAERAMLRETFLANRSAMTVADVVEYFAPALRAAADRVAGQRSAPDWTTDEAPKDLLLNAIRDAGNKVAFSCGLKLLPPFHLDLESPSFQQQRLEAMQRELAERRTAGQVKHFQRAADLLRQFRQLQQEAPQLTPGMVLRQIGAADQGAMLETLLLASAKEGHRKALWAVGGDRLVRIDERENPSPRVIALPPDAGPARSVQSGRIDDRSVLLIGTRSGVIVLDPDAPQETRIYLDPQLTSPLGFNAAVAHGGMIWASHGNAGLVAWAVDDPSKTAATIRPDQLGQASGPRNLRRLDDARLIFSTGPALFTINRDRWAEPILGASSTDVLEILPTERELIVVRQDGEICRRDRRTLEPIQSERRSGDINAAAALPWLGSVRLLLAGEHGPVVGVGLEDGLLSQYLSPHQGLRMIAATEDAIAAVSADRQRVVLWNSWDGRKPVADLHLTSLMRHRIADVEFA